MGKAGRLFHSPIFRRVRFHCFHDVFIKSGGLLLSPSFLPLLSYSFFSLFSFLPPSLLFTPYFFVSLPVSFISLISPPPSALVIRLGVDIQGVKGLLPSKGTSFHGTLWGP